SPARASLPAARRPGRRPAVQRRSPAFWRQTQYFPRCVHAWIPPSYVRVREEKSAFELIRGGVSRRYNEGGSELAGMVRSWRSSSTEQVVGDVPHGGDEAAAPPRYDRLAPGGIRPKSLRRVDLGWKRDEHRDAHASGYAHEFPRHRPAYRPPVSRRVDY